MLVIFFIILKIPFLNFGLFAHTSPLENVGASVWICEYPKGWERAILQVGKFPNHGNFQVI